MQCKESQQSWRHLSPHFCQRFKMLTFYSVFSSFTPNPIAPPPPSKNKTTHTPPASPQQPFRTKRAECGHGCGADLPSAVRVPEAPLDLSWTRGRKHLVSGCSLRHHLHLVYILKTRHLLTWPTDLMPPQTFKYSHVFIWILPDLRLTKLPFVVFKEAAACSPGWCSSGWDEIRLLFLCFSGCFFFFLHGHRFNSVTDARLRAWSRRLTAELPHLVPPAPPPPKPAGHQILLLPLRPSETPSMARQWCLCKRKELSDLFIFLLVKVQKSAQTSCLDKWRVDTTTVCTYQVTVCIHLNFVSFFQFTRLSVKSIKCFVFLFLVLHFTKINHFELVIMINSGSFCWHFYLTSLFCFFKA